MAIFLDKNRAVHEWKDYITEEKEIPSQVLKASNLGYDYIFTSNYRELTMEKIGVFNLPISSSFELFVSDNIIEIFNADVYFVNGKYFLDCLYNSNYDFIKALASICHNMILHMKKGIVVEVEFTLYSNNKKIKYYLSKLKNKMNGDIKIPNLK